MDEYIPIFLIVGAIIIVLIFVLMTVNQASGDSDKKKKRRTMDKGALLKQAEKTLAQNPKDPGALLIKADVYYGEEDYEQAMKFYRAVIHQGTSDNPDLDDFSINLKYGLSCLKMKQYQEAYKALVIARSLNPEGFETNFNLGYLEFLNKRYEKSSSLFKHALLAKPDHNPTAKYLGQSLFKQKRPKEALNYLKRASDTEPNDKETLFYLGMSYFENGQSENALRIFTHLRPDPQFGPKSALLAGTINLSVGKYEKAIMDLEIGLRHKNIPKETNLEIRYRLATAYTNSQEVEKAMTHFQSIKAIDAGYKDVDAQLRKLGEFSSNRNLQTFMVSPNSEFITLCRRMTGAFFPKAGIKIVDVSVHKNDYCDILAEVNDPKWEDIILFRFVRSTGQTGELFLRDLQARFKDLKAGRGFCVSAGTYSESAKRFVEARLIDLVEKQELLSVLKKL
jgi:tetratricopeptide (TPR) repeat protein